MVIYISIRHRSLKCLGIELYKIFNGIFLDIMKYIFQLNTSSIYDIRNRETFCTRLVKISKERHRAIIILVSENMENNSRSSRPEVFLRRGVLKICSKFTGEHPRRHGCSPVNLLHIFRTPFPKSTSGQLLL